MKARISIIIMALLMVVSVGAFAADKKKQAAYQEVTFVTDIECKNCVKKCQANLPYEKGIKDCKIDLATKTVYFKFDPKKTSKEKLAKAIERLGYSASEVQTDKGNK
ncbi:MAG: heavy-metal-associated domain-containing protein [Bacteroidales bacterium]|nr:heavy-metal-associated domain-containing protein [Bacteroidales bacterium]